MSAPDYITSKAVARANASFYRAFRELDLAAMRKLWLDDPSVKCVHPGGEVLIGTERVLASWEAIFSHTQSIEFEIADLAIEVYGEVAWVTDVERIQTPAQEGWHVSEAAATNLYVLRGEEWRIVLHHASLIARRFFAD